MMTDHRTLVALAYERMLVLVRAGQSEDPDARIVDPHGWSIHRWMWHAGIGSAELAYPPPAPCEAVGVHFPGPLDTGPHYPDAVAAEAMRRLIREARVEKGRHTGLFRVILTRRAHEGRI